MKYNIIAVICAVVLFLCILASCQNNNDPGFYIKGNLGTTAFDYSNYMEAIVMGDPADPHISALASDNDEVTTDTVIVTFQGDEPFHYTGSGGANFNVYYVVDISTNDDLYSLNTSMSEMYVTTIDGTSDGTIVSGTFSGYFHNSFTDTTEDASGSFRFKIDSTKSDWLVTIL